MVKKEQKKGKRNYRGIIAIILLIAIIVIIVIFATRKNEKQDEPQQETYGTTENGEKYNTSEKLQGTKTFDGYEISNIYLKEEAGENIFTAKIKNVTENSIGNKPIYIVFKNETGEELYKMQVYISEIKPGKSTNISSKIAKDVVGAYDIELQF